MSQSSAEGGCEQDRRREDSPDVTCVRLEKREQGRVRLLENGVCRRYGWRKRNGAGLNLEGENWGTAGAGAASVGVQGKGRDRGGGRAGMMMTPNLLGTDRRGTVVPCRVLRTKDASYAGAFITQ